MTPSLCFPAPAQVTNAIRVLGWSDEDWTSITQVLAAVLHLGNVTFEEDADESANQVGFFFFVVVAVASRVSRCVPSFLSRLHLARKGRCFTPVW